MFLKAEDMENYLRKIFLLSFKKWCDVKEVPIKIVIFRDFMIINSIKVINFNKETMRIITFGLDDNLFEIDGKF